MWRVSAGGAIVLLAGLTLAATGCIKLDSTLDINADGSGLWHLIYSMPPHMIKQVQNAAALAIELRQTGGDTNAAPEPLDVPMLFDEVAILWNGFVLLMFGAVVATAFKGGHTGNALPFLLFLLVFLGIGIAS